jgi:hypothetical protein
MNCTAEDMVAEGDKVTIHCTWSGTHRGAYMGRAPTGKRVTLTGIHILGIGRGKIVEEGGESHNLGFMEQLGAKLGSLPQAWHWIAHRADGGCVPLCANRLRQVC